MATEPTLGQLIKDAIRAQLMDTHVALPVRVEAYNAATQRVDVLPLLERQLKSGPVSYAVIPGVPVQWQSAAGGNAFIHMPLAVGDTGLAVFVERSLDKWLTGTGGAVSPGDVRIHNISDAVFLPGLRPFGAPLSDVDAGNMVMHHKNIRITMTPDGKISIEGSSAELLGVIFDTLAALETAVIVTPHGPGFFDAATVAKFAAAKADLVTIKRV